MAVAEGRLLMVTFPRERAEQCMESALFKAEHLDRANIGTVENV